MLGKRTYYSAKLGKATDEDNRHSCPPNLRGWHGLEVHRNRVANQRREGRAGVAANEPWGLGEADGARATFFERGINVGCGQAIGRVRRQQRLHLGSRRVIQSAVDRHDCVITRLLALGEYGEAVDLHRSSGNSSGSARRRGERVSVVGGAGRYVDEGTILAKYPQGVGASQTLKRAARPM